MVGHRTRAGRHGFDRIEAAHLPRGIEGVSLAARREVLRVGDRTGTGVQEIRVDREHHVGLGEVVTNLDRIAERGALRHFARTGEGIVDVPFGLGHGRQQLTHQAGEGWRRARTGDDPQAFTLERRQRRPERVDPLDEGFPAADLTQLGDCGLPVRVVEVEHRRLHDRIGGAPAGRMLLVAFDLGRAAHMALRQNTKAVSQIRSGGREKERFAGNDVLGLPDVGHHLLRWLLVAGHEASQRQ